MTDITNEAVDRKPIIYHVKVGTTPVRLGVSGMTAIKGIVLTCPDDAEAGVGNGNTAPVWFGSHEGITADLDIKTGGKPLAPGRGFTVPYTNPYELWARSTSADQDVCVILL